MRRVDPLLDDRQLESFLDVRGLLKLARNTLFNLVGLGAPLLVAVISIPELIRSLGEARFGMLALIWAVTSYFGLFDLGLGRALTQQLAIVLGEKRHSHVGPLSFTALGMMTLVGVFAGMVLWALAPSGVAMIRSLPQPSDALHATWMMSLALPAIVVTSGLRGMLEAKHAFALVNAIRLPMGIWTFAGPWLVILFWGPSLTAIATALALGRWIAAFVHAALVWRTFPQLNGALRWDSTWVRPLTTSGGWLMVSNIVSPLLAYVDRFLIGAVVSAAAVAYYTTPQEILTKLWIIPGALTSAMFPTFALLIQRRDSSSWVLFDKATYALFIGLLPPTIGLALFAPEILGLWLRNESFAAASAPVMQIFTLGIFLSCLAHVPVTWLQSSGNNKPAALVHLTQLLLYGPLVALVASKFGMLGAAWVWLLRISADSLAMFWLCHRRRPAPGMFRRPAWLMGGAVLTIGCYAAIDASAPLRLFSVAILTVLAGLLAWRFWREEKEQEAPRISSVTTCHENGYAAPLVTIVTPVFNQADFVCDTVESVLRQDYKNVEYIVIDDGSTDQSWEKLTELSNRYPNRFRLYRHENVGQAETLNRGWAMATGDFLAYLSSDDLLHSSAVSNMVRALQASENIAVAYCDFRLIDANGQRMADVRTEDFSVARLRDHLVCQPGPGAFFRREVLKRVGGWAPDLRQVPDFEFWLRAANVGDFVRVPLPLADYRVHDESASFRPMVAERADEIVRVVSEYWRKQSGAGDDRGRFALGMSLVISAMNHAQSGRPAVAFRRLGAGLRTCPAVGLQLIVWRRLVSGFFRRAYYQLGVGT